MIHSVTENLDRTVVSDANGIFVAYDVKLGRYEVTAEKPGFETSRATTLDLSAKQHLDMELFLGAGREAPPSFAVTGGASGGASATSSNSPGPSKTAADPPSPSEVASELDAMKARIDELEAELKAAGTPAQPAAGAAAVPVNATAPTPATAAAPQAAAPAPTPTIPEALQAPDPTTGVDNFTPFAFGDFSWRNGTGHGTSLIQTKFFTDEIRFDSNFIEDFNQPRDHTMGGATESFRSGEFQVEQISFGGDFRWNNVRGRVLTMFGLFATTTPRNDASAGVGQWDLRGAYRYISEAWGGYSFNVNHGLNVDAGIFVSYIGLFSYYNFDNWTYQPSFVSSNTPWFFNGVRIQWFPTNKLKIEPWIINGWQSYAKYNGRPGLGGQILWTPREWLSLVFNNYGMGDDNLGNPNGARIHADYSYLVRYYNKPDSPGISTMAFSVTTDAGCQYGGGLNCFKTTATGAKDSFLGWMAYNRISWDKDHDARLRSVAAK